MGRVPTGKRKYTISHMWDVHHEIKRRIVMGHSNGDIAKAIGCTKETVSTVRNSPIVMAEVEKLREKRDENAVDVASEVNLLLPNALEIMKRVLDPDNTDVPFEYKFRAAEKAIMPGGFCRAPHKIQGEILHGHLTLDDIEEIKERARLAKESGVAIDVEFEESPLQEPFHNSLSN